MIGFIIWLFFNKDMFIIAFSGIIVGMFFVLMSSGNMINLATNT